jgi:hypothetical protein
MIDTDLKRWFGNFIERVSKDGDTFFYKVRLTPMTRWGQLRFHWFKQADTDRYPHNHPADFWTFPLTSYMERCWPNPNVNDGHNHMVRAWRWHRRSSDYTHVVLSPFMSFIWWKPEVREWGFYVPLQPGDLWYRKWIASDLYLKHMENEDDNQDHS